MTTYNYDLTLATISNISKFLVLNGSQLETHQDFHNTNGTYNFFDSFNGETAGNNPSNWTCTEASATDIQVNATTYITGGKSVKMVRSGADNTCYMTRSFTQSGDIYIGIMWQSDKANSYRTPNIAIRNSTTQAISLFSEGGKFQYFSGGFVDTGVSVLANTWYLWIIRCQYNSGSGKYDKFDWTIKSYNATTYAWADVYAGTNLNNSDALQTSLDNVYIAARDASAPNTNQYIDKVIISATAISVEYPIVDDPQTAQLTQIDVSALPQQRIDMSTFNATIEGGGTVKFAYSVDGGAYSSWLTLAEMQAELDVNASSSFDVKCLFTGEITKLDDIEITYSNADTTAPTVDGIDYLRPLLNTGKYGIAVKWNVSDDVDIERTWLRYRKNGGSYRYMNIASGAIASGASFSSGTALSFKNDEFGAGFMPLQAMVIEGLSYGDLIEPSAQAKDTSYNVSGWVSLGEIRINDPQPMYNTGFN